MKNLNEIISLSGKELREFISTDENFKDIFEANFEVLLQKFLEEKALLPAVEEVAVSKLGTMEFISQCIKHNLIPSKNSISGFLTEASEKDIMNFIEKFPSHPFDQADIGLLLNLKKTEAVAKILLDNEKLVYDETLFRLVKDGGSGKNIVKLVSGNQKVMNFCIEEGFKDISAPVISELFLTCDLNLDDSSRFYWIAPQLSSPALDKFVKIYIKEQNEKQSGSYYYSRNYKSKVNWSPEIEEYVKKNEEIPFEVSNVPEGSVLRANYISNNIKEATTKEIIEIIEEDRIYSVGNPKGLLLRLFGLGNNFDLIKKVPISLIERYISPSSLRNLLLNEKDSEMKDYFWENMPSKYRSQLKVAMPEKVDLKRKKSYFSEMLEVIQNPNLDEFNKIEEMGYSLEKFIEDCDQTSKQSQIESLSLTRALQEYPPKITKKLIRSKLFSERDFYSRKNLVLDLEDSLVALNDRDIREEYVYDVTENKMDFVKKLTSEQKENLLNSLEVKKVSKDVFDYLVSDISKYKEMTVEMLKELAKIYSSEDLKKFRVPEYRAAELLNLKCNDGKYFISDKDVKKFLLGEIEDKGYLSALQKRDPELFKGVIKAYLKGNKELSSFFGFNVKIRRSSVDLYESLMEIAEKGPEEIILDKIKSGVGILELFKSPIEKDTILDVIDGMEFNIDEIDSDELSDLSRKAKNRILINIKKLLIKSKNYKTFPKNIVIKEIEISGNYSYDQLRDKDIISLINKIEPGIIISIDFKRIKEITLELLDFLELKNIEYDRNTIIEEIEDRNSLNTLKVLDRLGFSFTKDFVFEFINNGPCRYSSDFKETKEILEFLEERTGSLSEVFMNEENFYNEVPGFLKEKGIEVLSEEEYKLRIFKKQLSQEGKDFSDVEFDYSTDNSIKAKVIKFIEDEIDDRFKKLRLGSKNLKELIVIKKYEEMASDHVTSPEELFATFEVPKNLQTKKIGKAIEDILYVKGSGFIYKINTVKKIVSSITSGDNISFEDIVDAKDPSRIIENLQFERINIGSLNKISENIDFLKSFGFLQGLNKKEILRFLRSASECSDHYLRDVFQMIESVVRGAENIKARAKNLKENGDQGYLVLEQSVAGVLSRLKEIASMDDIVHIHDRLVPILAFIKDNPLEPLGQDYLSGLENSIEDSFGLTVYFPKLREDLQKLGNMHGWCVSYHGSYAEGVINKGNILAGICKKGESASIENTVALAHFVKEKNGSYYLEQLKWSKKVKGSTNVDATRSFDHALLLKIIKEYIEANRKKIKLIEE